MMQDEQYLDGNIAHVSVVVLANEIQGLLKENRELIIKADEAHRAGDMSLALSHASLEGVVKLKSDIISKELERRAVAGVTLIPEERKAIMEVATAMMLDEMGVGSNE